MVLKTPEPSVEAKITHTNSDVAVKERPLKLPVQIYAYADVARLSREVENVNSFFAQASLSGASTKSVPQASVLMNALFNENSLNVLQPQDRQKVTDFLKGLRDKAPIVHASFASDPRPDFLMKLVQWFRAEAHPHVLFRIGLQPNIAAGCVFRTTNKYFDFSFKKHFEDSKIKLASTLGVSK